MHITIINDSSDANAAGRQLTRAGVLVKDASLAFIGVPAFSDLAAAGNLVDALDAAMGEPAAIVVNVAPRHTPQARKQKNGTPFCYFFVGGTLVVATMEGFALSLVKKVGALRESTIHLLDVEQVAQDLNTKGKLTTAEATWLSRTQFRSYEFAPRLAAHLLEGYEPPSHPFPVEDIPEVPLAVWWIDNFGNLKTTALPEDIDFVPGAEIETALGTLRCYEQLAHVPPGELACVVGSSGYGSQRFIEIVAQGERAAALLDARVGQMLRK
ncbi:MAG: hypothetical protein KatS3mg099_206 [Candidatus Parcubacteria bacterium]|nr:MAG: hypothetical protein KatS3mg099_206 [Candidatus Parcubacteria bacterium]